METWNVDSCAASPFAFATYRKASLRIAEVFHHDITPLEKRDVPQSDIVRHRCRTDALPGATSAESYTLWVNLRDEPQRIFGRMSRATRSQIRRAITDGFRYEFHAHPSQACIGQFVEFYALFAKSCNLRAANRHRLLAFSKQDVLDLSRVVSPEGRTLVWHANIRSGKYIVVEQSASLFRNEVPQVAASIGRANRLLHWRDILRFRDEGFSVYDLGGWYPGGEDAQLLRINRFKKEFGGELIRCYNCDQSFSWKGTLALWLRRML